MSGPLQLYQVLPDGMSADTLYVVASAGAAFLCVWAIGKTLSERDRMGPKIKALQERRKDMRDQMVGPKKRKGPETSVNFMRSVAIKLQLIKNFQIGRAESTLMQAGYRSKDAIFVFAFFNLVLPIVLGVLGFIAMKLNAHSTSKWQMIHYIWPFFGAYMGMKLPWYWLARAKKKRYLAIQKSLSDVLDLMTICAEAGLSLSAMLDRVSRELALAYPEMAEEMGITSIEIGFLPERNTALTHLAERVTLPEVRGMVSVLIQTEKYGTPIAQALRVLSTEFRTARMLRAEQKAARLPAIMTIPMIVFILPTLFIVIIAPAAVKLLDTLASH